MEKSRAFAINRASILGFRAIGGGHTAASKGFSFLGVSPINKDSWADHTKKLAKFETAAKSVYVEREFRIN